MKVLEICAVFCFGIVPIVIIGFLMVNSLQLFDDEYLYLGLLAFVASVILFILYWFCQMKNSNHQQLYSSDVEEFIVKCPEIEDAIFTKSPSATNTTPILAPIFTNLTPNMPLQPTGYAPASVHQSSTTSSNNKGYGASSWYNQCEQPLPSYQVAMGIDVAPPTYADFMTIELTT